MFAYRWCLILNNAALRDTETLNGKRLKSNELIL